MGSHRLNNFVTKFLFIFVRPCLFDLRSSAYCIADSSSQMFFVAPSPTQLQSRVNQKRFLAERIRKVTLACIIRIHGRSSWHSSDPCAIRGRRPACSKLRSV